MSPDHSEQVRSQVAFDERDAACQKDLAVSNAAFACALNVAFSGAPLAARPLQELVGPQSPLVPALFAAFAYNKVEPHTF